MAERFHWLKISFGKYWFVQFMIIIALLLYAVTTSVSILVLVNQSNPISNNNQQNTEPIVLTIIFNSQDSAQPISWNSVVLKVTNGTSLFDVMNSTFSINGTSFGTLGYLITQINTIKNAGLNAWTYYYFTINAGWVYASVGVSHFYLNHDYQIKWVYGPASS